MSEQQNKRDALTQIIIADVDDRFAWGRINHIIDLTLSILTVLASLAASVLVAAHDGLPPWVIAAVAAIPAASVTLQRVVDFRSRSIWFFLYSARLRALAVHLQYSQTPDLEKFAQSRGALDIEMEADWPRYSGAGERPVPTAQRLSLDVEHPRQC